MKALSLWQPWASFVADGHKQYETRSWATRYRGLLAIHASKRWTQSEQFSFERLKTLWTLHYSDDPPLGAVLCVCKLNAIYRTEELLPRISQQERAMGDYTSGRFAWQLEIIAVPSEPIPAKGMQGLWDWTPTDEVNMMMSGGIQIG